MNSIISPKRTPAAGSLTVETALVLPIFMFAMITTIFIAEAVRFSERMTACMGETAQNYAMYAYAYEKVAGEPSLATALGGRILAVTAAKAQVVDLLGEEYVEASPVESGSGGISFIHSSILDTDEMIDLVACYRIDTPYDFLGIRNFPVTDRIRVRAFTGYDNTRKEKADSNTEEMVFITDTGTVYHRSRGCSHLNFNIFTVNLPDIDKNRNNSGAKYYPCEHCAGGISSGMVYITDDGNRYHSTLSCPDLTRKIKEIPISQVGARSPCKDCSQ